MLKDDRIDTPDGKAIVLKDEVNNKVWVKLDSGEKKIYNTYEVNFDYSAEAEDLPLDKELHQIAKILAEKARMERAKK